MSRGSLRWSRTLFTKVAKRLKNSPVLSNNSCELSEKSRVFRFFQRTFSNIESWRLNPCSSPSNPSSLLSSPLHLLLRVVPSIAVHVPLSRALRRRPSASSPPEAFGCTPSSSAEVDSNLACCCYS
ncbi:hypothetical protein PIB30_043613 [Stylosanthes scabra]|uniref:Uncharacterized protein n=1 Tax=Stylosanthes scabra TaxID=79078 RepID=A0ABU6UE94_9FABA|nr:hypothetical protein [Stylosanthes scabra]